MMFLRKRLRRSITLVREGSLMMIPDTNAHGLSQRGKTLAAGNERSIVLPQYFLAAVELTYFPLRLC
jgi:hypothetical protein